MSLKAFHLVFVTVSTILCAGFCLWAFRAYQADRQPGALIGAVCSLIACVALVVYGRWFLRKLKGVSYL